MCVCESGVSVCVREGVQSNFVCKWCAEQFGGDQKGCNSLCKCLSALRPTIQYDEYEL